MRLRDVIATVLDNLRRMRLKIVLTTLGVVIGTASVVLMVSIGAGLQRNIESTFERYNIATQITVMSADMMGPSESGGSSSGSSKVKKLDDKAVAAIEEIDGVVATMPRLMVNVGSMRLGDRQFGAQVYGVSAETLEEFGIVPEQGRMMTSGNEVVVGAIVPALAVMDFESGGMTDPYAADAPRLDMLGKRIVLEIYPGDSGDKQLAAPDGDVTPVKRKVLVTAILKSADPESDTAIYLPLKSARRYSDLSAKKTEYQQILVKTKSANDTERINSAINEMGYLAQTQGGEIESVKQVFTIIQVVLGGIGGIALLVASLGIANTMTMSIYERTREIGIMKAVGASGRQIRQIFLGEAASIGLLGGVGGLLVALGIAALANLFLKQATSGSGGMSPWGSGDLFYISAGLAIFAVVFAACIGLVAGILPAIRAANLDPLTALRHE